LPEYVIPRLARRLARAHQAHSAGTQLYLEHGQPALKPSDGNLVPPPR
jgi:hypothetical protein